MNLENDIYRFIEAQDYPFSGYAQALKEIQNGRKTTHWIWYIFPQLRSLGRSSRSTYWGIRDRSEAVKYLNDPILNRRLREITEALLLHEGQTIVSILGEIDSIKVQSCMTLFDNLSPNDIYGKVLDVFYEGKRDRNTLQLLDDIASL